LEQIGCECALPPRVAKRRLTGSKLILVARHCKEKQTNGRRARRIAPWQQLCERRTFTAKTLWFFRSLPFWQNFLSHLRLEPQ
jgi:hypothetical protein